MEIIAFDISGKMAHFRKYYANNTAMSFSIPPRTTLMGVLAALLGFPKGSYHEKLASDKIRIAVSVVNPIKKSFHRLNLLRIVSTSDFNGKEGRIQTPFEVVTGLDLRNDNIKYRIYISCFEAGQATFNLLKDAFLNNAFFYNLTLGIASFSCSINNIQIFDASQIVEKNATNEIIFLNSAAISDSVARIFFDDEKNDNSNFIEEELMPADFISDYNRELSKMNRVLFSLNNIPLKILFNGNYYELIEEELSSHIQFLE